MEQGTTPQQQGQIPACATHGLLHCSYP
jgi:hypothetical protein